MTNRDIKIIIGRSVLGVQFSKSKVREKSIKKNYRFHTVAIANNFNNKLKVILISKTS